jgi:hypothetical protein
MTIFSQPNLSLSLLNTKVENNFEALNLSLGIKVLKKLKIWVG